MPIIVAVLMLGPELVVDCQRYVVGVCDRSGFQTSGQTSSPWNFLTPKIIARPSLSRWAYFFSASERDLDANAMGFSPSGVL